MDSPVTSRKDYSVTVTVSMMVTAGKDRQLDTFKKVAMAKKKYIYKVTLTIGYPTADHEDFLEYDEKPTPEQLEEDTKEWAYQYIEYGHSRVDEDGMEIEDKE